MSGTTTVAGDLSQRQEALAGRRWSLRQEEGISFSGPIPSGCVISTVTWTQDGTVCVAEHYGRDGQSIHAVEQAI